METKDNPDFWHEYISNIKKRDEARHLAEAADRTRRKHWREYYTLDKRIKEMDEIAGICDVVRDIDEEEKTPMPTATIVKRKREEPDEPRKKLRF